MPCFVLHCLGQAVNYDEAASLAEDESSRQGSPNEDLFIMLLRRSTFVAELAEGKLTSTLATNSSSLSPVKSLNTSPAQENFSSAPNAIWHLEENWY